jgi:hypothetical protein
MAQDRVAAHDATQADSHAPPVVVQDPPGVQALRAVLATGMPEPGKVVELIDAYRGDHDAMFALLQQTLGNGYVQRVLQTMDHLRLSVKQKELAAGDPGNPEAGYFLASQQQQGAKWRTANGNFTGTVDKKGLDTTVKVDPHDALHARVGADKNASLAWEHDGKNEGELYGHYGNAKDYEVGLRRTQDAFGGSVTEGVRHRQTASGTVDEAYGSYKSTDGKTEAQGAAGVANGHFAGNLSASQKLGEHDTVKGDVSTGEKGTSFSLSEHHALKDGAIDASVKHTPDGTTVGVSGQEKLGEHDTVSGSVTHDPKGTSASLSEHHTFKDGSIDASVKRTPDGHFIESLAAQGKLGEHDTLSGSVTHGPTGTSGTLTEHHALKSGSIDTSLTHEHNDKGDQTSLTLGEKYRSGNVVQGLDLSAGTGTRDYLNATGSVDAKLAPNLYGGAWGSFGVEGGHHATAQLGASLTFTPQEKTALTLAGVVDEHGVLETRLQLDVFKDRLNGIGDIADHKKDALVSLFVSYSTQTGHASMLDNRFGAPQKEVGNGQIMGGIKIRF